MIEYLQGDATNPSIDGEKIIVHVCNDIGKWGKGFVMALSRRSKTPEIAFLQWFASGENFALGEVQFVPFVSQTEVANIIGQHGIKTVRQKTNVLPPIRYDALEKGLETVAIRALETGATIHMPRIGCGLAGGKWDEIEPIIQRKLCARGIKVFVYDLPDQN